ncbi:MAG: hypothetical protein ABIK89_05825 [Planctomycetota bacterium]
MVTAARINLLLAAVALTLAAVAAAAVCCGWYDSVAGRVGAGSFGGVSAAGPAAPATPVGKANAAREERGSPPAVFQAAMTPEDRFERLVEGVIDLAIEEVGEQMRGQEATDAETRRQFDERRGEACRKRREMYVVFSQEKEG